MGLESSRWRSTAEGRHRSFFFLDPFAMAKLNCSQHLGFQSLWDLSITDASQNQNATLESLEPGTAGSCSWVAKLAKKLCWKLFEFE